MRRTLICKKSQKSRPTGISMASPRTSRRTVKRISPPHLRTNSRRPVRMQYRPQLSMMPRTWAVNRPTIVPTCKSSKWRQKLTKIFSTQCQPSKMRSNSHQNRQRIPRHRLSQYQTSEHLWKDRSLMRSRIKKRCPIIHHWLKMWQQRLKFKVVVKWIKSKA